jgi:hypothetical protein
MTGGALPPFMDNVPFQEGNQEWLKDGDVIVSTGAKAGTTWMLFCSHQIRVKVGFLYRYFSTNQVNHKIRILHFTQHFDIMRI